MRRLVPPWAASPAFTIPRSIFGIAPTAPGYHTLDIKPEDPGTSAPGHLVNGTYSLAEPLQVAADAGAFAPLAATPAALLAYDGPVSNDPVTLRFKQAIGSGASLRTGSYSKTLTFTLSTDTP